MYVFSKWRSTRPVKINQYDITMTTHYDINMDDDIVIDAHCEITIGNDVARDIYCDVTMSNDVAMCTYHGITMHNNDIAMNLFYNVFKDVSSISNFYSFSGIRSFSLCVTVNIMQCLFITM